MNGERQTVRLTGAQALVRYAAAQVIEVPPFSDGGGPHKGEEMPFLAGCWAIFGHGNVAALGEALHAHRDDLPTFRGHNEQTMAHAAIAYAKASLRHRAMMVTTSIGPGATNLVTAAALAHVNRLPVLLVPGDTFASRRPDPVLQQVEDFEDGTVSANDCFRPVSRFFDRIVRPEQLMTALPRAFAVMTDPAQCGPVTLAFAQDAQAEAYDFPLDFFVKRRLHVRRPEPDRLELEAAIAAITNAKRPLIVAGGGVHYSNACDTLKDFAETYNMPVAETQAGKSAMPADHPMNVGPIGVTGGTAANELAAEADVVLAVGTRLQDFTTGSWGLFQNGDLTIIGLNVQPFDATKRGALPLVADAARGLEAIWRESGDWRAPDFDATLKDGWAKAVSDVTTVPSTDVDGNTNALPTDMQVVGAVQRAAREDTIVMGAAGTMPGELHKLWSATHVGGYHMEYGFSCMGYEIAGALGIKLARPDRDVIAMVGDGSYLMANSELATAVMMGVKITVVITDNRGFGCINRLQSATGGAPFNNLLDDAVHETPSNIDFAAHAASMGATAVHVGSIAELEDALAKAREADGVQVVVIDTDPGPSTEAGGTWWEVAVPAVSDRSEVHHAREAYEENRQRQRGTFASS